MPDTMHMKSGARKGPQTRLTVGCYPTTPRGTGCRRKVPCGMKLFLEDVKWLWRRAALIGAVLALLCRHAPVKYQGPCAVILTVCRLAGGTHP